MQNKIKLKTKDDNLIVGGIFPRKSISRIFPSNQIHEFIREINFTHFL